MLQPPRHAVCVTFLSAFAAGCGTTPRPATNVSLPPSAGVYKIGNPYQIGDTWYYPHEQPDYDETGVASWYGPTFEGKQTANGERFDGDGLSAAHRTLPMPVNVRVTNLDNGKSLVLRVNDRGPFAKGRIIDVSRHAAELLGFYARGTAKVRVTYLGRADLPNGRKPYEVAPEIATAVAAVPSGKIEVASLQVPDGVTVAAPPPVQGSRPTPAKLPDARPSPPGEVVTNVPVPAATHLYVQAGAFSTYENANRLKQRFTTSGLFISRTDREGRPLYRVRSGPYDDLEAANAALARLAGLGNNDAEIVVDQ